LLDRPNLLLRIIHIWQLIDLLLDETLPVGVYICSRNMRKSDDLFALLCECYESVAPHVVDLNCVEQGVIKVDARSAVNYDIYFIHYAVSVRGTNTKTIKDKVTRDRLYSGR
jgi:hypothetical protein